MLQVQLRLAGCIVHCSHPWTWADGSSALNYASGTDRAEEKFHRGHALALYALLGDDICYFSSLFFFLSLTFLIYLVFGDIG